MKNPFPIEIPMEFTENIPIHFTDNIFNISDYCPKTILIPNNDIFIFSWTPLKEKCEFIIFVINLKEKKCQVLTKFKVISGKLSLYYFKGSDEFSGSLILFDTQKDYYLEYSKNATIELFEQTNNKHIEDLEQQIEDKWQISSIKLFFNDSNEILIVGTKKDIYIVNLQNNSKVSKISELLTDERFVFTNELLLNKDNKNQFSLITQDNNKKKYSIFQIDPSDNKIECKE